MKLQTHSLKNSPEDNPTLKKIELFKDYKKKKIPLNELVDKIYEIDNPPQSKMLRWLGFIVTVLLAGILSSRTNRD